jgi:hypothetical protein
MRLNPQNIAVAVWQWWKNAPRPPLRYMSGLGSAAFVFIPATGLIGAARCFLGLNGNAPLDRLYGFLFLAVGLMAAFLDYHYVKRPVDPYYD